MKNINIELKRCCLDCEDFSIEINERMEYEAYGRTKYCDITCNHNLVCKRFIDDADNMGINEYLDCFD